MQSSFVYNHSLDGSQPDYHTTYTVTYRGRQPTGCLADIITRPVFTNCRLYRMVRTHNGHMYFVPKTDHHLAGTQHEVMLHALQTVMPPNTSQLPPTDTDQLQPSAAQFHNESQQTDAVSGKLSSEEHNSSVPTSSAEDSQSDKLPQVSAEEVTAADISMKSTYPRQLTASDNGAASDATAITPELTSLMQEKTCVPVALSSIKASGKLSVLTNEKNHNRSRGVLSPILDVTNATMLKQDDHVRVGALYPRPPPSSLCAL